MLHKESWYREAADKILFQEDGFTLRKTDKGRIYIDSPGGAVAVLAFRRDSDKPFLAVREPVEIAGHGLQTSCVFGGRKGHGTPEQAAVAELLEEGGIEVDPSELIDLGDVWFSKSIKGKVWLFGVDVTGLAQNEPEGDGSWEEEASGTEWVARETALQSNCGILSALIARLDGALSQS